jgi:hypothetical protein
LGDFLQGNDSLENGLAQRPGHMAAAIPGQVAGEERLDTTDQEEGHSCGPGEHLLSQMGVPVRRLWQQLGQQGDCLIFS